MTDAELEQRDEAIAEAITSGRSLRSVRNEFSLSAVELDATLEKLWPVDTAARLRVVRTDLGKLDRLIEVFLAKGLQGDPIGAGIAVKIWERKHDLIGVSAVKIDLSIAPSPHQTSRHDKIRAAVFALAGRTPPALPADGNGDGSSTPDGDEPSH